MYAVYHILFSIFPKIVYTFNTIIYQKDFYAYYEHEENNHTLLRKLKEKVHVS